MLHIRFRRVAALFLAGSLAFVVLPGIAIAHAELQTASPADKSTVTEPVTVVSGIYTEAMTPDGSSIVVKDAGGATVAKGTVDPANTSRMVATPATPLGTGTYAVAWTSVALDGHVERGTWTFKVAVAPTPSPTPVPTVAPSAAASATPAATASTAPTPVPATPVPTTAPTPSPSADGSTTGSSGDVVLPIIIALIVLGAGAAYLFSRRGQRPTDPT